MILGGWQIVKETPYHTPFLWVFAGGVVILEEGTYTICDTSNEGSKVWIAGKLEIDNDGLHPSKQVRLNSHPPSPPLSVYVACSTRSTRCMSSMHARQAQCRKRESMEQR